MMASIRMDENDNKALEQALSRLAQLSSSLQSLRADLIRNPSLPPPSSLLASTQILHGNLRSVLDSLQENSELFARTAVHPSTNYPGRSQENILTQLLRKKLEPDVEELVEEGRETAKQVTPEQRTELLDNWAETRKWLHGRIATYVREEAGDMYTRSEREAGIENVRTGLKRDLDDDNDDDDDDEDEDEDGDGEGDDGEKADAMDTSDTPKSETTAPSTTKKGPELETLLWFAARGDFALPNNIEYERKGVPIARGLEGINIPPEPERPTTDEPPPPPQEAEFPQQTLTPPDEPIADNATSQVVVGTVDMS